MTTSDSHAEYPMKDSPCHDDGQYQGARDNEGLPHGNGTMTYRKRSYDQEMFDRHLAFKEYRGQWQHGKRHGKGTMEFYENGFGSTKYTGEWRDGLPDGKGQWESYGGTTVTKYKGGMKQGKRHGQGAFSEWWDKGTFPPESYDGEWADDKRCGYGVAEYKMPSGFNEKYEGMWQNNMRNGQGTYTYQNGDRYEGEWVNGRKEGRGVYTHADGRTVSGIWKDNSIEVPDPGQTAKLEVTVHHHGFDYNRTFKGLADVQVRHYTIGDLTKIYCDRGFDNKEEALEIIAIHDDGIRLVVPEDFCSERPIHPIEATIKPGETLTFEDVIETSATIYDEDYDYDIVSSLTVKALPSSKE